jgi:signal peptidase
MKLKLKHRRVLIDILAILAVIILVTGVYFGFRVALATPNPWVAVASESMKPALEVGDLVIVQGTPAAEIKEGEIIVFNMMGENTYTIHRVITKERLADGTFRFRTKGDATPEDPNWIPEQSVHGRVLYRIPYIGWIALDPTILIIFTVIIIIIAIFWPEIRHKWKKHRN